MSLDILFPAPSQSKSPLSPSHWPGISPHSTDALREILSDNQLKWHIFFNEKRFHNHAAHRAIASWALGASAQRMKTNYEKDGHTEKPAFDSPHPITADNLSEHLGDERFYNAYLTYFTTYVKEKGVSSALEEFLFTRKANLGSTTSQKHPLMLSRFLSGVMHPIIHTGYGAEFDLPGMIVEGLAQTAVHLCPPNLLTHLSLFDSNVIGLDKIVSVVSSDLGGAFNTAVAAFDHAVDKVVPQAVREPVDRYVPPADEAPSKDTLPDTQPQHALSILAHLLRHRFPPPSKDDQEDATALFEKAAEEHGKYVAFLTAHWAVTDRNIEEKIEEIAWTVSVLYAIAGWTDSKMKKKDFNADFFFMHLVTSSIFLPALCAMLSKSSQVRLLQSYFSVVLVWVIARGQPPLDIKGFMEDSSIDAILVSSAESDSAGKVQDPWMDMISSARDHHDEHVTKIIRSLAGWSSVFGARKARNGAHGQLPAGEVLPEASMKGAEWLDGSLFMRAGILTLEKMGWEPAGRKKPGEEEPVFWDMDGFFAPTVAKSNL